MSEQMISVEKARAIVLEHIHPMPKEHLEAWRAVGLPLAADATTDIDLSPFANSAMDGYAVRTADLADASQEHPVTLTVTGHEAAGHVFSGEVGPGESVRIMTGAPVPAGADAVVKYEIVEVAGGDGTGNEGSSVTFRAPAKPGENIREAGLEAHACDVIMHAGEVVTAAGAGLLTSAGVTEVAVRRAPRVGILSVGTELVPPTEQPQRGQIRDANGPALMAAALDAGAEPRFFGIVADDEDAIAQAVLEMTESCDLVVTSGGASAGDYDYIEALVQREGEVLFDRISMRPGKAITFGLVRWVPFLGLSGNPAAACVGFEMLARPAIRAMRGHTLLERPLERARVTHDVRKRQERRFYDRARVARDPETGEATVTEERSQNSALLGTLHRANCLLMVPEGLQGYTAGDEATCVRIDLPEGAEL